MADLIGHLVRSWQMPALAMLSGQKSARESIQAPDDICPFALSPLTPKPPYASNKEIATLGDIAPGDLPKVLGASTAPRDNVSAVGEVAVFGGRYFVWVGIMPTPLL